MGGGNLSLEEDFVKVEFSDQLPSKAEHDALYDKWVDHFSSRAPGAEETVYHALRQMYPSSSVILVRDYYFQIFAYPTARITPLLGETAIKRFVYVPNRKRIDGIGNVAADMKFAAYRVEWNRENFILYQFEYAEGFALYREHAIIHDGKDETAIKALVKEVSAFALELHEEIWVFNQGFWQKDHELWSEIQKANWKDVILRDTFKKAVRDDINGFFASEQVYRDLGVPWKRGVIFFGPPGNGKTISLKATMKECPHPSLYVKSLQSYKGEEGALRDIFQKAREMAPCILVFEDMDSHINDRNRSFFLNEIDGLEDNNGLLIIGTTNHFDKLDPSLSKRPSRFDRKYLFPLPNRDERILYAKYWQNKLRKNPDIEFPDSLMETIADATDGFSFAYLKEAFVSTLILLAGDSSIGPFEDAILKQIKDLKKQLEQDEDKSSSKMVADLTCD
jgi:AAA+ superfamily predicted ATPase